MERSPGPNYYIPHASPDPPELPERCAWCNAILPTPWYWEDNGDFISWVTDCAVCKHTNTWPAIGYTDIF